MYSVQGVEIGLYIGKNILDSNEKEGNKRKNQPHGRFYSSLLPLPYRYCKWRLKETKICAHRFRNVTTAVAIVRFREEEFSRPALRPDYQTLHLVLSYGKK